MAEVSSEVAEQVTCDVKYSGYVMRQAQDVARQQRLAGQSKSRLGSDFAAAGVREQFPFTR